MRAALYVRVSSNNQVKTQTIDQQLTRLKAHVTEQGWILESEHIYRDDGYSGAKLARPGLDSLRDRAGLTEFDVVLITAPDRLARNYVHQMLVMEELERRGIRVVFLDRPMSDDPHDRLLLQIRGAVAEYERTLISERMRRGRLMKYKKGELLPWTHIPYGYGVSPEHPRDPDHVYVDEAKAAIVVEMFHEYLEPGATLYKVAKHLTDRGLPTPTGKVRWSRSTVRGILTNTAYIGTTYANRFKTETPKRRRSALQESGSRSESMVERPKEEWIAISVPVIVDEALFVRVQAKLAHNQQGASRNNKVHNYLLRGLVSCGMCRLSARGRTSSKYRYYVCRGRTDALRAAPEDRCTARFIPADQLDQLVWKDLCEVLTHPESIAYALERAHGGHWLPQELRARMEGLAQAQAQIARQKKRLLDAYLAEVVSMDEFQRKQGELAKKLDALTLQKRQLDADAAERIELSEVADSIEAFCEQVRPVLETATFEQKRQLVELLIDRVVVLDEDVEIRYVIPTNPDGPHQPFCQLRTAYRRNVWRHERPWFRPRKHPFGPIHAPFSSDPRRLLALCLACFPWRPSYFHRSNRSCRPQ